MTPETPPEFQALHVVPSSATRQSPNHAENEDSLAVLPEVGLFVVADGVGGHVDGGLASRSIVEILSHAVEKGASLPERMEQAEMALQSINRALRREAEQRPKPVIIGSTVALLLLGDGYAACLWAGDSRIYLERDGDLYQLTRDHTLAAETQETDARAHNTITRAIGPQDDLELDRIVTPVDVGDTLLVCSDGLTKVVSHDEIGELMREPITGLADRLVARAVILGSRDDVTVIVVRIVAEGDAAEARAQS
ncbi:MAG: PP2C family protein-serine/threonine phosphatase [Methylovirgula sp.]